MSDRREVRSTIWPSARVSPIICTPLPTSRPLAWMIAVISLAASDERWARLRTSPATTAKPPRIPGARGFDPGIEREQVGLERDALDQRDDFLHLEARLADLFHRGDGLGHRVAALAGTVAGLAGAVARLLGGHRGLGDGGGQFAHGGGRFLKRAAWFSVRFDRSPLAEAISLAPTRTACAAWVT
jgi:hypothetical protein